MVLDNVLMSESGNQELSRQSSTRLHNSKVSMGCLCVKSGRANSTDEGESTIQQYEASLGFSKLPVEVCVSTLEETSRKGGLTSDLLRVWLAKLGIPSTRLEIEDDSIACLFTHFFEKGRFSCHKLGTLAVLMGEGSIERKATSLFRVYGRLTGELSQADIESLATVCCELALVWLPGLAETETLALRDLATLRKLQKYTEKFSKFQDKIKEKLAKPLLALGLGRMTEAKFVGIIVEKASILVSTQNLRAYAFATIPELARQSVSSTEPASAVVYTRSQTRNNTHKTLMRTRTSLSNRDKQSRPMSYG